MKKCTLTLKNLIIIIISFHACISLAYAANEQAAPNQPVVSTTTQVAAPIADSSISVWTNELITAVYTFNENTAEDNLKNVAKYFSPEGWPVFIKALNDSKILESAKQNHYIVTAVAQNPPQIISKGVKNSVYTWTVKMPTLVSYANKSSQYKMYLDVTLTIIYSAKKSGIRGLAATQFIATQVQKPTLCQCEPQ